jgi:F0F1-type ATP synthase membrane subunit a
MKNEIIQNVNYDNYDVFNMSILKNSHFIITLSLSLSFFIEITIVGFQMHGLHFFSLLLPQGIPLPLAILFHYFENYLMLKMTLG